MISRHVCHKPENDNYRRLADYIADAGQRGEKALMSWCAGCWSDDDYQLAIHEVEAVQARNTRSRKEKTYHLVISFRPEDESTLSPEVFREIELEFARALGFEEHQRHAGVHKNTANIHLHIAYNEIHPERLTRHEPFRDYATRDQLCRQLEKRYGLAPDKGRNIDKEAIAGSDKAKSYEIRTGQESLLGYAQRHRASIMNDLAAVETWADCHQILHKYGLSIKPYGNGLVFRDLRGKNSIKASDLDRNLSKGKLEKRFGKFEATELNTEGVSAPEFSYASKPLQQGAERDDLYAEFCRALKERRSELEKVKKRETILYKQLRSDWDGKWAALKKLPMLRKHRQQVLKEFEVRKKTEQAAFRSRIQTERSLVRDRYPFASWNKFLQHKAGQGNEAALAILRSRKTKVKPQPKTGIASNHDKNILPAVAQMLEVLKSEATPFRKALPLKYHIDGKGVIIFTLPNGGAIRDHGQVIHFSAKSQKARELAGKLAYIRWGQNAAVDHDVFKSELVDIPVQTYRPEQSNGHER